MAWPGLGIAATALMRGGDEQDAVNLVALAQLTACRYAVENAMPTEPGEPADNGAVRTAERMERAANVLRMVQAGPYEKRWDKALARWRAAGGKTQGLAAVAGSACQRAARDDDDGGLWRAR